MKGVALTREQGSTMHLSETQRHDIDWRDDVGPEPGGVATGSPHHALLCPLLNHSRSGRAGDKSGHLRYLRSSTHCA
jgi:hypothetical protein